MHRAKLTLSKWQLAGARMAIANMTEALRAVRERFSLVLRTERMAESMVLLRSVLCWRWSDVILQGAPLSSAQQDRHDRNVGELVQPGPEAVRRRQSCRTQLCLYTCRGETCARHASQ